MSVIVETERSFFFSSDPNNGAENISADGSQFSVTLNAPLQIPKAALACTIEVAQANVWYVTPNISADFGNNIFTFTTTNAANPGVQQIVIPDGLYSLAGLSAFLSSQFVNLGLPANLITIGGVDSTQQTVITFLEAGDFVDFTVPNSCRQILGFDSRLAPTAPQAAGWNEFSDNPASFNRVNSYAIRSNLVSEGIPINNTAAGLLVSIPIDVSPGSQIVYQPRNPTRVNANELIGQSKLNFQFQLTDQQLRPTPTVNEYWTFILTFRYSVLLTNMKVPMMTI